MCSSRPRRGPSGRSRVPSGRLAYVVLPEPGKPHTTINLAAELAFSASDGDLSHPGWPWCRRPGQVAVHVGVRPLLICIEFLLLVIA